MQSCRILTRALSSSVRRPATQRITNNTPNRVFEVPNDPGYKKVMDLQKLMCADDGLLVWQKRGARDLIFYYLSMGLMFVGTGYSFYQIFRMSMPKKN